MEDSSGHRFLELEYRTLREEILQNDRVVPWLLGVGFFAINLTLLIAASSEETRGLGLLTIFAYLLFSQLIAHKAEATARIGSYLAECLEPTLPGASWERRLRRMDLRLWWLNPSLLLAWNTSLGLLVLWKDKGLLAVVGVLVFAYLQHRSLKRLAGPDGFARRWREIGSGLEQGSDR
ncbi:MAG: hypothetical protein N2109_08105 [Fimbriimonadales bacterium]|nr:hypothetical protein [Fimbriimonadales bacterium]